MKNYYHILGLQNFASLNDIRRAYRRLALRHHPDRGGDAERMKELNQAYEYLMRYKEQYDSTLRPRRVMPRQYGFTIVVNDWGWTSGTASSTPSNAAFF